MLATPTVPFKAVGLKEAPGNLNRVAGFTGPFNVTGQPAISIPDGFGNGLPTGLQLIGPIYKDELVLRVAYTYEQVAPRNDRSPPL